MMFKNIFFTLILSFGFGSLAQADDSQLSKQFTVCVDKAAGVTSSTVDCITAETKRQDIRLNQAYKNLLVSLSQSRKQELLDTQRLWIKFRDANCNFYYDPDGGSIVRITSANCFMNMTAERAGELENLASF